MNTFFVQIIILSIICWYQGCGSKKKKADARSAGAVIAEDNPILDAKKKIQGEESALPAPQEVKVGFREAFIKHLRPILLENCNGCHIHVEGTRPFAGKDEDKAVQIAQTLMGSDMESSRFYVKVSGEGHPNEIVSTAVLPILIDGLTAFFNEIDAADMSTEAGIVTPPVAVSSLRQDMQTMSNVGIFIIEAEGTTVDPSGKFVVSVGPYSNGLAVASIPVQPHPTSGESRTFAGLNLCQNQQARVSQPQHTGSSPFTTGEVKYHFEVTAELFDGSNQYPTETDNGFFQDRGNRIELDLFNMLPNNQDPYSNSLSYPANYDPVAAAPQNNWTAQQIDTIKRAIERERAANRRSDGSIRRPKKEEYLVYVLDAINNDPSKTATDFVRNYQFNKVISNVTIDYVGMNPINMHGNENVPLSALDSKTVTPGKTSFKVRIPNQLTVAENPQDNVRFKVYVRGSNDLSFRLKNSQGEEVAIDENGSTCFARIDVSSREITIDNETDQDIWREMPFNPILDLGETYEFEILQVDEGSVFDAMMLVADVELNEQSDPDLNATKLRHPVYGLEGGGLQQQVQVIEWPVSFGRFQMEMIESSGFYALQSPVFLVNPEHAGKNILIDGFDILINGKLAITDKIFDVTGVRPGGAIVEYGQVNVPKPVGSSADEISIRFHQLELTDLDAEIPSYNEPPPTEIVECRAADFYTANIWPLYSQQLVVRRDDYNDWLTSGDPRNSGNLPQDPELYRCKTCHNEDHPYYPIPDDPAKSCVEALKRSNLKYPELSYALRGARGQFNHIPLYTVFDPFEPNSNNLRQQATANGTQIYGFGIGMFETFIDYYQSRGELSGQLSAAQNAARIFDLTQPRIIGYAVDEITGDPTGTGNENLGVDANPEESVMYRRATDTPIAASHDDIISRYVQLYEQWINLEIQAREP